MLEGGYMNETLYNILDRIEKQGFEAFIIGGYVSKYDTFSSTNN